jgi:hypothetical protein
LRRRRAFNRTLKAAAAGNVVILVGYSKSAFSDAMFRYVRADQPSDTRISTTMSSSRTDYGDD